MFKRLVSRLTAPASSSVSTRRRDDSQLPVSVGSKMIEPLENRRLFHSPAFTSVIADNRGEVFITVAPNSQAEIDTATVNKNSVQMYEAGTDGILGNADDVRVAASIRYTASNGRLLIRGAVPAGNGYRVKIVASRFKNLDGGVLDGEFNGASVTSGNGVAGGNFEFQVKNDKSTTPLVRMYTSEGLITLRMRGDVAPRTVRNYMSYANSGRYDNVFFTRSENNPSPFVIQGGSLQITGDGTSADDVVATTKDAGIAEEFNLSNVRGTVAMAKNSQPNSTTNQFFISLADNSFLDAQQFSVFAQLYGSSDQAVADAINQKPVADLNSQIGNDPNTGVDNVPVQNEAQAEASLNPFRDLIYIRRIAQRSKVAAL